MLVRIACTLVVSAVFVLVAAFGARKLSGPGHRQALWRVVQTCVADYKFVGAPFPCVQVNLAGGEERGYVAIYSPFGRREMIVAPTQKMVGVEDPRLQSPAAPNYFEAAWRARSLLGGLNRNAADVDFALAVNPAATRKQDQLHIHLGCLLPDAKREVEAFASRLQVGGWSQVPAIVYDAEFWGLPLAPDALGGVNPFRLAAEGPAGRDGDRSRLMILLVRLRIADGDRWLLLASNLGGPGTYTQIAAEDLLDPTCAASRTPTRSFAAGRLSADWRD